MPKQYSCCLCKKRCKPNNRRHVLGGGLLKYLKKTLLRDISTDDILCLRCSRDLYRTKQKDPQARHESTQPTEVNTSTASPKSVRLQIPCATKSHRHCIICKKATSRMVVVSAEERTRIFLEKGIYVKENSRCCRGHIVQGCLTAIAMSRLEASRDHADLNRSDIIDLLGRMRLAMKPSSRLDFDNPSSMTDEEYVYFTGLTKDQFAEVLTALKMLRNTSTRSTRTCLAILFVKLRTGLSNNILTVLFSMKKHQIRRSIHAAKAAMMNEYVPVHLGFQHMSHESFVAGHTTPLARSLFSPEDHDAAILILDGTYIYIQKSAHYLFQRVSYSMHKHRPLVKMMVIVASDGYILSVLGPYRADGKSNDAMITKHIFMSNSENLKDWIAPNDVCVVDRGFRDSVEFLEEQDLNVEMPVYLKKGTKQHSTEEANLSRLVTKVRWVVESANGRIKNWKLLDKVVSNHYVPSIGDFVRIVCAVCNHFRPPIASRDPEGELIANEMLRKSKMQNHVQQLVEENNLIRRRSTYTNITETSDCISDFPALSLDSLRHITMGVYQLKQAPKYTAEHIAEDGDYCMQVCKELPNLLRVQIQSRHSNSTMHNLWVQYECDSISGWYCTCKSGARVVGTCAHIASVLWYLGYQRHLDTCVPRCDKMLDSVLDASVLPETDSESEDEDGDSDSPVEEE